MDIKRGERGDVWAPCIGEQMEGGGAVAMAPYETTMVHIWSQVAVGVKITYFMFQMNYNDTTLLKKKQYHTLEMWNL